ncbi:hypothetical protein CHS0354_004740 [Potamilus streckersoni]|uniref:Uncharacterized protein n=1 Tax=Potamilus streckersoni TaxID=2493646 RepID=A0AAE0WB40_9BIVA|nr:hypothetical protein CHS0354_004740 [Potamilus streckersoni]
MFRRKKKSPSAKDIASLSSGKSKNETSSPAYSSLPKSMFSSGHQPQMDSLMQPKLSPTRPTPSSSGERFWVSNTSSNQETRGSPLDLPMETLQSISAAYSLSQHQQGYMSESVGYNSLSTSLSSSNQRSPFQSPVHTAQVNAANNRVSTRHRSLEKGEYSGLFSSEQDLDRQFERLQLLMPVDSDIVSRTLPAGRDHRAVPTVYARDRSLDREQYPHMGARSLERDHHFSVGRSRSSDRQDLQQQLNQSQEFKTLSRDSLILELQSQITDLNKECAKLQADVDSAKDKLSSTMNSIKTFWSPELKKERALRKEESAKYSLLNEQLKVAQAEMKKQSSTIRELETSLRRKDDAQFTSVSESEHEDLKRDYEHQNKEIKILRKTVGEMDIRLETQKQTLAARDESIKKLLEMLQSKGLDMQKIDQNQKEIESFKIKQSEDQRQIASLQAALEQKNREISSMKEQSTKLSEELDHAHLQLKQQPSSTHTMQAILEAKDSRIAALEKELQNLEDKLHWLGEDGAPDKERKDSSPGSLKETVSSKEKALKAELESLKGEFSNKDTEIAGLKMKLETFENQKSEHRQYINVLKEQITAKEQHCSMLQADIEDLRERLREKDETIEKKGRLSQTMQQEKRRQEAEVAELKDQMDIKDRKITILQRKVENLEDLLKEKEEQLINLPSKLLPISTNSYESSSDSAISSMEESLYEKERLIERLKDQREQQEREHQDECDQLLKTNQDLKARLDSLQIEVTDKQTELCELREELAELKSSRYQLESKQRQNEHAVHDKNAEIEKLTRDIEELKKIRTEGKADSNTAGQIKELKLHVEQCQAEMQKAQTEVDRLLEILKETENEKNEKDKQNKELQDTVKEYKQKFGTLKRITQTEKKKNAQLLEEARKREEDIVGDAEQLKETMKFKCDRIEELEEALRESVRITAEREMAMVKLHEQIAELEKKVSELSDALGKSQASSQEYSNKLASFVKQLEERDNKLKRLQSERHKHLEEVFEMKQEAIQAAISEKDANIALLEMTSTKKQKNFDEIDRLSKEKEKLQQQLKEVTQNRMRLLQKEERGKVKKSMVHKLKSSTPEQVDPYMLTAPESLDS